MLRLPDRTRHPTFEGAAIRGFFGRFRFLSNFHPASVDIGDGLEYPSSEHAYMAQKTLDRELRKKFSELPTPAQARALGQAIPLRSDWDAIRIDAMARALASKFDPDRHPELAGALHRTGELLLVEDNDWGDRFWGVCDGSGESHLGRLLMERRSANRARLGACPSHPMLIECAVHSETASELSVLCDPDGILFAKERSSAPPAPNFMAPPVPHVAPGPFLHRNGGRYDLLFALSDLDGSEAILYRARSDGKLWIRPKDLFFGTVDTPAGIVQRFVPDDRLP